MFKTKSSHAQTKPNESRENTEGKDGTKHHVNPAVVCFHFSQPTPDKQEERGTPAPAGLQHRRSLSSLHQRTEGRRQRRRWAPSFPQGSGTSFALLLTLDAGGDGFGRGSNNLALHKASCGFRVHILYDRREDLIQRKYIFGAPKYSSHISGVKPEMINSR